MYHYQDPPEIQSPEQRSVVFAVLACFVSYWLCIFPYHGYPLPNTHDPINSWWAYALPAFTAFVILYFGSLQKEWAWPLRVAYLSLVSVMILVGMLAVLIVMLCVLMFSFFGIGT
jgi:hypothetical protein